MVSPAGHPKIAPTGWGNRCFPSSQSGILGGWGGRVPHEGRPRNRRHDGPLSLLSHSPAPPAPKRGAGRPRTGPKPPPLQHTYPHMCVDRDPVTTRTRAQDRADRDVERFLEHYDPSSCILDEAMHLVSVRGCFVVNATSFQKTQLQRQTIPSYLVSFAPLIHTYIHNICRPRVVNSTLESVAFASVGSPWL